MRAKSALSAFIAGLAFAATVITANPAVASHHPDWNYPITPWSHRDEVLCGTNTFTHVDGRVYATAKVQRHAGVCGGAVRPGPGPLKISMQTLGLVNGYLLFCHNSYEERDTSVDWIMYTSEDMTSKCPPFSGFKVVNQAGYGGVIYGWQSPISFPQSMTWYP